MKDMDWFLKFEGETVPYKRASYLGNRAEAG